MRQSVDFPVLSCHKKLPVFFSAMLMKTHYIKFVRLGYEFRFPPDCFGLAKPGIIFIIKGGPVMNLCPRCALRVGKEPNLTVNCLGLSFGEHKRVFCDICGPVYVENDNGIERVYPVQTNQETDSKGKSQR